MASQFRHILLALLILAGISASAAYKARPWNIRPVESYPCRLTSEGVTIAVDLLFQDSLAAGVFDKNDIVSRGIMPLGIIIFNENDFPVMVDGSTIEVLLENDRIRSLQPVEAVRLLFKKSGKSILSPTQRTPLEKLDMLAMDDFERKFIQRKSVAPHAKGGGFLYLSVGDPKGIPEYFSKARVYVPDVIREDSGGKMIYFEVDLKPTFEANEIK